MKKLILTLCLAATGTFAAVAQMRLTLDQALDLALSENPTVKVAEMARRKSPTRPASSSWPRTAAACWRRYR